MRCAWLPLLGFTSLALAPLACSSGGPPAPGEKVIRAAQAIQGGAVDQQDSAVVAILINTSQGMSLCSGTLVGPNLVLSAHHCVADSSSTTCSANSFGATYPAADFVVTTNYDAAGVVFNSGAATLPKPDDVTWFGVQSVAVPGNDICGQDLSALTLSTSMTGACPIIPSVDTDVTPNETYTAIGFGITSPNGQTAGTRYKVGGMVVQCAETCNDPTMSATEEWSGGSNNAQGTCEGDSGGPAIDSSGRAMGSVSRGPANACNQTVYESYFGEGTWIKAVAAQAATAGGYTAAGWVTGGATSNPANGYGCSGVVTTDGGTGSDAGASSDAGTGGSDAGGAPTTCSEADGTNGCCDGNVLYYCNSGSSAVQSIDCTAGGLVCGWNANHGYYDCVTPPGGPDPSGTYPQACGGTPTTDAGAAQDAGGASDAGWGADGGADAGSPPDAGGSGDDGSTSGDDAGALVDAGSSGSDAALSGAGDDASGADATTGPDADTAGTAGGGGADFTPGSSGSCGCTAAGSTSGASSMLAWVLAGLAAAAIGSRRSRRG